MCIPVEAGVAVETAGHTESERMIKEIGRCSKCSKTAPIWSNENQILLCRKCADDN